MKEQLLKNFTSGVFFGISLVLIVTHILLSQFHTPVHDFWHHALPILYTSGLFLSIRKPAHNRLLKINNTIKPLLYVIEFALLTSIISVYLAVRYLEPQHFIIISVFISAIVICIGWWVQSIIASARQRRQHTVNTIIQTRISDTYQRKLAQYNKCFSDNDIYIDKELAKHFAKHRSLKGFGFTLKKTEKGSKAAVVDKELKKIEKSMYGAMYLLNFFEFISAGIRQGDLDNRLLMDCFRDVVRSLERKCYYILTEYRFNNTQADIFKEFERLCANWLGEKSLIQRAHKGERLEDMLGQKFSDKTDRVFWD